MARQGFVRGAALVAASMFWIGCSSSSEESLNPAPAPPPAEAGAHQSLEGIWECVESGFHADGFGGFGVGGLVDIGMACVVDPVTLEAVVDPETGQLVWALKLKENLTTGRSYLDYLFEVRIPGSEPENLRPDWCFNYVDDEVVDFCYGYDWLQLGPAAWAPCYVRYGLRLTRQVEVRANDELVETLVGYEAYVSRYRAYTELETVVRPVKFERRVL